MSNKNLHFWAKKLSTQNTPVLNNVIMEINQISGSEDADANRLSEVILKDPNLTSHVLRVANSVQYNYGKGSINTVSRAVVLIGLKGMRAICISLKVLESLLKEKPKERVLQLIAQGFHAAAQARNLIFKIDEHDAEEAFIAALLFNLGEMAFWASEDLSTDNEALISADAVARKKAMDAILGTSFKAVTRELAKTWNLGETLEHALFPPAQPSEKIQAIVLGERISRASLHGWESPQVAKVLSDVARFAKMSEEQAMKMIIETSDKAAEVALNYGVSEVCPLIPMRVRAAKETENTPASKVLKGDPHLQLNILRELATATKDKLDVNMIFQMVLEGMHRGIGLERVAIAFISHRKLQAKYLLGEGTEHWREAFNFDVGPYSENIFTHAIERGGAHWFTQEDIASNSHLYPDLVARVLGKLPAFVSVMEIDGRKIAAFYADRWTYGGKLNNELFESFKHFTNEAQTSLNLISKFRKKV